MVDQTQNTDRWQALDYAHHLHPFTDFKALAEKGSLVIERASDIYVYDTEGNEFLDGMSGLWTCGLGYSQPEIVNAIHQQLEQLPYYNNFFQCSHTPAIELARAVTNIAPAHCNHVFFTSSGSEANDTNIRLVYRYWDLVGLPEKKIIIGRKNGYHGSTIAGASLGGMSAMHEQFLLLPNIEHIDQPYFFESPLRSAMTENEFGLFAAKQLERKILQLGTEKVAAFIGEPIQGAGGVIIPPKTYWPEIQRICKQYNVLLIADEVITGFGRTGHWFSSEYFQIKPDLITFAKAVTNGFQPLGGVLVGDRIAKVLMKNDGEFSHGFTYSGHPVACAAALATLNILKNSWVIEKIKSHTANYFSNAMATLVDHPLVGEVRTLGLLAAIELVKSKHSHERFDEKATAGEICRDACTRQGLIMRAVGDIMVTAPPLIISDKQIDELVCKARGALDQTLSQLT